MPVQELPDLVVTSRTQSQETINKILKEQGYDVSYENTVTDEPVVEIPPETTEAAPTEPPATEEVVVDPPVAEEPPAGEVVADTPPTVPHKKPGSKKYKEQRDQARIELEALKLEQTRRDAERLAEIEDLKRKLADPAGKTPTEQPKPAEEPPKAVLPEKPKLVLPKFKEPKLSDPDIDNDWDKLEEARARALEQRDEETARLTEEYNDKIAEWRDQVREAKEKEKRETDERAATAARETERLRLRNDREEIDKLVEVGESRYPGFKEVVTKDYGQPIMSGVMSEAIAQLRKHDKETAADILHWISTHPDEANKLCVATMFPEKDGVVQMSEADKQRFTLKVYTEFGKILAGIKPPEPPVVGDEPDDEEEEDETPETQPPAAPVPVAQPPVPVRPPPAPPVPPAPAPKAGPPAVKKPSPPSTVGTRGATSKKKLSEMSETEVRSLPSADYRRLYEEEYGKG